MDANPSQCLSDATCSIRKLRYWKIELKWWSFGENNREFFGLVNFLRKVKHIISTWVLKLKKSTEKLSKIWISEHQHWACWFSLRSSRAFDSLFLFFKKSNTSHVWKCSKMKLKKAFENMKSEHQPRSRRSVYFGRPFTPTTVVRRRRASQITIWYCACTNTLSMRFLCIYPSYFIQRCCNCRFIFQYSVTDARNRRIDDAHLALRPTSVVIQCIRIRAGSVSISLYCWVQCAVVYRFSSKMWTMIAIDHTLELC